MGKKVVRRQLLPAVGFRQKSQP